MNSIQRRLSVGLITTLIVTVVLLLQTSVWLFETGLRHYLQNDLQQESEVLLLAVARNAEGLALDNTRLSASYSKPFSGHYFRIETESASWRSRSLWDHVLPVPAAEGLQTQLINGPQAQRLLIYRQDFYRFDHKITIVVAQDYTPISSSLRRVQWIGLVLGAAALLVILLLQRAIVARALTPIETVRRQIAQLQQGHRAQLDTDVPAELVPLVDQINTLLAHTENMLQRSRSASANLGHALKTPVAVLLSLSEREELVAYPELRQKIQNQLQQIQRLLSRELSRTRLGGDALPGAHFDCAQELPDLFATLTAIHRRDLQLHWQAAPGLRLPWDREDMLELLGNLLDNACKWARSTVKLDINKAAGGMVITVDDDGPGIDPEQREAALSRGARLDEQISGHGLGLDIVRDIVAHYAGELALDDSPLGGLRVVIRFPGKVPS